MVRIRLVELLSERGMSIYRLALETGITEATLYKLRDQKTTKISFEVMEKLCRVFDCKPNDLLEILADPEAKNK